MKKLMGLICVGVALIIVMTSCACENVSGNGPVAKEKSFKDVVDQFVEAIDNRDKEAVFEMFSEYVREKDKDLNKQINRLFKVYKGPTTEWYYDEMLSGEYTQEHKTQERAVSNIFPLVSNGQYYWCSLQLVQSNEKDSSKVGIKEVSFFTAEDYYVFCNENKEYKNKLGLAVYAEEKLDFPVCCIGSQPYDYNTTSTLVNKSAVSGFFRVSRDFEKFKDRFGKPRAVESSINCFYEMFQENEEKRYLELNIDEDTGEIITADVLNSFEVIENLLDNRKKETQ